jgi:hypothetical protein
VSLPGHVYKVWVGFIAGGSPGWAAYDTTEAVDEWRDLGRNPLRLMIYIVKAGGLRAETVRDEERPSRRDDVLRRQLARRRSARVRFGGDAARGGLVAQP